MLKDYERRFNRIAISGLIVCFILLMVVVVTAFLTYNRNQESSARVEHTHRVLDLVNRVQLSLERAETSSRGYLLVPDETRLQTFDDSVAAIPPGLDELERSVSDNDDQRANVAKFRDSVQSEADAAARVMDLAKAGQFEAAIMLFERDAPLRRVAEARQRGSVVIGHEERLLAERRSNEQRTGRLMKWVLGGGAFLMLLVGAFTLVLARRYTNDLATARDRLRVLNEDLEGEVDRRTADLTRANEEIQRFAYIVSHDLRSPLVNILGFTAELEATQKVLGGLIDRAKADAPAILTDEVMHVREDLPEAIGFIRAATQKMDRLINAILKLSREGRRSLTPEPLHMDDLIGEIVGSMSHKTEEGNITVVIDKPLPDLTSDRVAIEQIFSNLIENATKYVARGRPGLVRVRGEASSHRVTYEVIDNGRGIDAKDHERIFDLFRRAGAQDRPGEGIGLAQVRALIHRLGGWIDVSSALGEGSTFRLNLPIAYVDEGTGNE